MTATTPFSIQERDMKATIEEVVVYEFSFFAIGLAYLAEGKLQAALIDFEEAISRAENAS